MGRAALTLLVTAAFLILYVWLASQHDETLYDILAVGTDAKASAIKQAYRRFALKFHPDKVKAHEREASEALFKRVAAAYEVLSSSERRSACASPSSLQT